MSGAMLPLYERARGTRLAPAQTRDRTLFTKSWLYLSSISVAQIALAYRPSYNRRAFIDEGLYVYMGHRMIDHLLHGAVLHEYPGSFFSGAPGFYPVFAALGDSVAGLQGARAVSLFAVLVATIAVFGLAQELFGQVAGVLAALVYAVNGSVIYQSHLAVYDSWMMMLFSIAAWLTVYSAKRDGFAWAPAVGGILMLAFLAKYAGAVYVPFVAALAVAVEWNRLRWLVVRRALTAISAMVVSALFVLALWGDSLWQGIDSTTAHRSIIMPATTGHLVGQVVSWVGPWLALATLGALFRLPSDWRLVLVLLSGSVVGAAQQIHIGDSTSLNKHVAFGLVFAAPLIGDLGARAIRANRRTVRLGSTAASALVVFGLLGSGLHFSARWLTAWVQDDSLLPPLRAAIALNPDKVVLAEEGAPERYTFYKEGLLAPSQYNDTYQLHYKGLVGNQAYAAAINQTHYGVIYLDSRTPTGKWIEHYLETHITPYRQVAEPPRYVRDVKIGRWLVYAPKVNIRR